MIDISKATRKKEWWAVFDTFVILLIALAMAYIGFMLGRHYCETGHNAPVNQASIVGEYRAYRVIGH